MKRILLLLAAIAIGCQAYAQELRMPKHKFLDDWSLTLSAGTNATFGDKYHEFDRKEIFGPTVALSLNKWWSPVIATRLQGEWGQNHVIVPAVAGSCMTTTFNRDGAYLDVLFNPFNLFSWGWDRPVNIGFLGGIGYVHTFDNGILPIGDYVVPRLGAFVDVRVNKAWSINVEGNIAAVNDKFDGVEGTARYDAMVNLMAGVTYKFKNHDGTRGFQYVKSYDQEDIDRLNGEINRLRANPVTVTETKEIVKVDEVTNNISTPVTIRFFIDSYDITEEQKANLENVALVLKGGPSLKAEITGYADAGTGNAEYNQRLSGYRADAVKEALVAYGIDASRLTVKAEGDKVQQYGENDWNRCAIIILSDE